MAVSGPVAISSLRVSAEPRPLLQRPEASRQSPAGPRSQWRLIGHKTCEADARPRPLSHGRANGESRLGDVSCCLSRTNEQISGYRNMALSQLVAFVRASFVLVCINVGPHSSGPTDSADAARGRFCHDRVFFAFATGNAVRKDSCPFRHRKEQVSVGVAGSQAKYRNRIRTDNFKLHVMFWGKTSTVVPVALGGGSRVCAHCVHCTAE